MSRFHKIFSFFFSLYVASLATSMSGMEIFSSAIICLIIFGWVSGKIPLPEWQKIPFIKPLVCFSIVLIIGVVFSDASLLDKFYSLSRLRFFLVYLFLFFSFQFMGGKLRWLKVLTGVLSVISVYGLVQHFISIDLVRPIGKKVLLFAMQDEKIGPLVVGTFNHHLTFANIYLFYACLFTALGISAFPKKLWLLFLGLFTFLLVAWTHSRMAWASIPICLFCIALKAGKRKALFSLAGCLLFLFIVYLSSSSIQGRFRETFGASQDLSISPRLRLWHAQIEMFKRFPLLGIGWNNNEAHSKEYVDRLYPQVEKNFYGHAHSEVLQVLSTTGLLGLLTYLWLWAMIIYQTLRLARLAALQETAWLATGIFAGFIGFHLQGLTQWNFGDAEVTHNVMFFWGLIGWMTVREN